MERKRYVQIAAVAIAVLILGGALYNYVYVPSLPRELEKFKFVFMIPPKDGFWEYQYAIDSGIYREEGLEVEYTTVRSSTEMMQALLSGEVDAIAAAAGDIASAQLAGAQDFRVVMTLMRTSYALWVKPGVDSIQEVKNVGLCCRGTEADILMREYLTRHGLEPDVDVTITYLQMPALMPAFISGQVDAGIIGAGGYAAMKTGAAKILFQFAKEFPEWHLAMITVPEQVIKDRPKVVQAFVRGLYRSHIFLMENKDKAIQYAVDSLGVEKDYATFTYEYAYEGKYGAATKIMPGLYIEDLQQVMDQVAKFMGVAPKQIKDVCDSTFVEQAKKELS